MFKFRKRKKLPIHAKNLLLKLNSSSIYKMILSIFFIVFSPFKFFFVITKKTVKKVKGIISASIFNIWNNKIGYIDDFIVDETLRGGGFGKKLFAKAMKFLKRKKCETVILVTHKDRIQSHKFYKKAGFIMISLGLFYIAYKKIKLKR